MEKQFLKLRLAEVKSTDQNSKFAWVREHFKVVWQSGETFSNQMKIWSDQGIYGKAFRGGHQTNVHSIFIEDELLELNFIYDHQQVEILKGFKFTAVCAIPDKKDRSKSVGIIAIESKSIETVTWLLSPRNFKEVNKELIKLAKKYSAIM